jgi:uncharacterized protein (DUF2336 family)
LSQSPRLNDSDLVENARIKGQGHMLAISLRRHLSEAVTMCWSNAAIRRS